MGALTLVPEFNHDTTMYTATTTNHTNTIKVTPTASIAVVNILANGTDVKNGQAVTWQAGENNVLIMVANGDSVTEYHIKVTKTEG